MSHFQVGSVVQFVSGGPKMTISSQSATDAKCIWFDALGRLQVGTFALNLLGEPPAELSQDNPNTEPTSTVEIETDILDETERRRAEVEAHLAALRENVESSASLDQQTSEGEGQVTPVPEAHPVEESSQADDRDAVLNKLAPLLEPQPSEEDALPVAATPQSYLDMIKRKFNPWG